LTNMFTIRGNMLIGLEAIKRAATEYICAAIPAPEDGSIKMKLVQLTAAASSDRLKQDSANHGKRIAVIEKEFGEVGIDDNLVSGGSMAEEVNIVEINYGCFCCTVRDDFMRGLKKSIKTSRKSGKPLHVVIIETIGLADTAPVAQRFLADDPLQQHMCSDGILALLDTMCIVNYLMKTQWVSRTKPWNRFCC